MHGRKWCYIQKDVNSVDCKDFINGGLRKYDVLVIRASGRHIFMLSIQNGKKR